MNYKYIIIFLSMISTMKADSRSKAPNQNLVFIYNAESGGLNAVLDYVHKLVSPDTYDCNLCKLTYDNFGQIKRWNDFLINHNISADYYYRDHLIQIGLDPEIELPAVFFNEKSLLLGSKEINSFKTLDDLIRGIKIKIYD